MEIMNDLILHSYRRCPFAIRVRMVLEEKSLSYTLIEEDLAAPSESLVKHHPEGTVPLLIHRGEVIYESSVITEYLEDTFPSPALRSVSALERARLRMWTVWCDQMFKPDLDLFKYELQTLSQHDQDQLLDRVRSHLRYLDDALIGRRYLMGSELGLADIHVFPFYRQIKKAHPHFDELFQTKRLNPWLEGILQRPSFERAFKK